MFVALSIIGIVALVLLGWSLYRRFGSDRIAALMEKRRGTARFVSRGSFVDGSRTLDVVLAVDRSTLFYENADMAASIDLQWLREVEYDTKLATGAAIASGKVLRLRSSSQTFEFVLPNDVVARWHTMLPRRSAEARS